MKYAILFLAWDDLIKLIMHVGESRRKCVWLLINELSWLHVAESVLKS
jgi:hypothetical protein